MTWIGLIRCPSCERALPPAPDGSVQCSSCPRTIQSVEDIPVFAVRSSQLDQLAAGVRASHLFNSEVAVQDHVDYTAHTLAIHRVLLELIERLAPQARQQRLKVLDVGGGRGELAFLFADRFDTAMIDIDLDSVIIARALQTTDRPFAVLCGDCSLLPLTADSADIVIAKETAHHMPDPPTFFAELARVAGRAGLVLVVEGIASSLADREQAAANDRMRQLGATHHHFILRDLSDMLSGIFDVSQIVWTQPQLFEKVLRRTGLPKLGERLDRLWHFLPRRVRLAALRVSGGPVVFACRGDARSERGAPSLAPAETLVDYPVELREINPLSTSAIDHIRSTLLNADNGR